jgi:hypothetical protein
MTTNEAWAKNLEGQRAEAVILDALDAPGDAGRAAAVESGSGHRRIDVPAEAEATALTGKDAVCYAMRLNGASNAETKRIPSCKP